MSPVTPFHLRAKERAALVLSPEELRAKIDKHKAEAEKALATALGMIRVENPSAKLCRAAVAHVRDGNIHLDFIEEYARQLARLS